MSDISVIGLGPGHRDYILPVNLDEIKSCDVIVGARRNLDALNDLKKKCVVIDGDLSGGMNYIQTHYIDEKIGVVVSGDTGFYSLLRYLKNNLEGINMTVFAGLSSMSLMFARLGLLYDDALMTSLHGKTCDVAKLVKQNSTVGFLTDDNSTPSEIAKALTKAGVKNKRFAVGERLSYDDEKVSIYKLKDALKIKADKLCVVVVYDE
jgi:cobalt-precorrin-7 (C5)-methyltransferase